MAGLSGPRWQETQRSTRFSAGTTICRTETSNFRAASFCTGVWALTSSSAAYRRCQAIHSRPAASS